MEKNSLVSLFIRASTSSIVASAINLLTTILIVRWLGESAYADYVIDLAVISLVLIVLEAVPSNYMIFKVQENPNWIHSAAIQAACSFAAIAAITILIEYAYSPFNQYTYWISVYAASMAIKRYLDIRLQSTGQVSTLMKLDAIAAILRLTLLAALFKLDFEALTCIWSSIALASLSVHIQWIIRHPTELSIIKSSIATEPVGQILSQSSAYPAYYLGIALKKFRDNLMPLAAERFFQSKEEMAAFFLAYRGLVFANGQVRILESLINHRPNMAVLLSATRSRKMAIASIAQIFAIAASVFITWTAEATDISAVTIFLLSMTVWPSTYFVLARAEAYSSFRSMPVNAAMASFILTLSTACALLVSNNMTQGTLFAAALLTAEVIGLAILSAANQK